MSAWRAALYRRSWDTRCRNLAAARALERTLAARGAVSPPLLLDVGSGSLGLGEFIPGARVVALDHELPRDVGTGATFHVGDIRALPFRDHVFEAVSCIDVLEHLPAGDREPGIAELVRVARAAVLIACPFGDSARRCDEAFLKACEARGRSVPPWLVEHQRHPYPDAEALREHLLVAAEASHRKASVSISYNEPVGLCSLLRTAAVRSHGLYVALELLLGALLPVIPLPGAHNSYRIVLLAEFLAQE